MIVFLSILRRLGLGLGAYIAAYNYFEPHMQTSSAIGISFGLALFSASIPPVRMIRARAKGDERPGPRGFEVVVPKEKRD